MKNLFLFIFLLLSCHTHAQQGFLLTGFDLHAGTGDSNPSNFIECNGKLFFTALDARGYELWISDGTPANTKMVKDIELGLYASSSPASLIVYNNKLFFIAYTLATGRELWMSDGTDTGTRMVIDLNPGAGDGAAGTMMVVNGKLIFSGIDTNAQGNPRDVLVSTDGTAQGTAILKHIIVQNNLGDLTSFTLYNGKAYFAANAGDDDNELWATDGTSTGTTLLKNIDPGFIGGVDPIPSTPHSFKVYNNKLYFSAFTKAYDSELWCTDGTDTGTTLVKDICYNCAGFFGAKLVEHNGKLYFRGNDLPPTQKELWVTDGTANGTQMVQDINTTKGSDPDALHSYNGKLYFNAYDNNNPRHLWVSDGTDTGTIFFFKTHPNASSIPQGFTEYKKLLYFKANTENGARFYRTDGTDTGTIMVAQISQSGQYLSAPLAPEFFIYDSTLFFRGEGNGTGKELWSLKDTVGSTQPGSVSTVNEEHGFSIYPNPTEGNFVVALNNTTHKQATISVIDISGKVIYTAELDNNNSKSTISLTGIAKGVYFVSLQQDGYISWKKLLVE